MGHPHKSVDAYSYERHRPEESLLYQVVAKYVQPFFRKCEESDHPVPKFVKREFEAFLRCGVLSFGFARIYCRSCNYDRLVAFSCKKRGFCGSCLARRMSDTSGRLIDEVVPQIPTRQWVLSLPMPLRYLVAYDNEALHAVRSAFKGTLFAYLRQNAKKNGGKVLHVTKYYPGAISFMQRFGSALNLNVHVHCQVSDGVYVRRSDGRPKFMRVVSPNDDEIKAITMKIAHRVHRYLEKRKSETNGDALEEKNRSWPNALPHPFVQ